MLDTSRLPAYLLLVLAYILGCVSLGLFGLFLWIGPYPIVSLNLATPVVLWFDALLAIAFFLQHSVMIRKSFRAKLVGQLPEYYQPVVYATACCRCCCLRCGSPHHAQALSLVTASYLLPVHLL